MICANTYCTWRYDVHTGSRSGCNGSMLGVNLDNPLSKDFFSYRCEVEAAWMVPIFIKRATVTNRKRVQTRKG